MTHHGRSVKKHGGVSLVEVLVASFLLVIVGTITFALFKSSSDASLLGRTQVKAQQNARNAMNSLQAELRQAIKPPRLGMSPQYTSGVLYPSVLDANTAWTNGSTGTTDNERIIFMELYGLGYNSSANINYQTDINQYRLVEYRVFPPRTSTDANEKARLLRRTWSAYDSTSLNTAVKGLDYTSGNFTVALSAFEPDSTDTHYTETTVIELPYDNDRITLTASHPQVGSTAFYDDRIFNIKLTVIQNHKNYGQRFSMADNSYTRLRKKEVTLECAVSLR
ncbi:MAG: hypothetical protein RDV48_03760 [Candidatus Eremiobacteraeota bacterium]|nr:hypothetical protein [Candidatus Eremiobacteraeota bacterium]